MEKNKWANLIKEENGMKINLSKLAMMIKLGKTVSEKTDFCLSSKAAAKKTGLLFP